MMFLILFFQMLVVVRDQARTLRPELMYSVRSLGAGGGRSSASYTCRPPYRLR